MLLCANEVAVFVAPPLDAEPDVVLDELDELDELGQFGIFGLQRVGKFLDRPFQLRPFGNADAGDDLEELDEQAATSAPAATRTAADRSIPTDRRLIFI